MLESVSGLDYILADHFKPYRVATQNKFRFSHSVTVIAVPLLGGIAVGCFCNHFVAASAGPIIAVFTVMASVMTAVMPTIQSLIGPVDRQRIQALHDGSKTSELNIREANALIARVEIVRSLYAAVAWSVIVLCISLVPLLVIMCSAFQFDVQTPAVLPSSIGIVVGRAILAGLVGFVGTTAFVALLQIVSGVHLMLRYGQVDIETDLAALRDEYHL